MKKLIFLAAIFYGFSAFAQKDNRIVVGTADTVYSNILKEKRIVYVHVPAGGKDERFPVLYILDGEDHFESAVAITDQMSGVIPPMIVVGITNTNRERDLTPTHVTGIKESGGGEAFMLFIEKELIPYIESKYPTRPYRILSGHSLGGLTVVNALLNHTGLFNAYIALDPSLWWDDQRWIKKNEDELAKHNFNKKSLFIAIANNMPAGEDTVSVLKDTSYITMIPRAVIPFVHFLRSSKPAGLRWTSKFYPDERHGTVELVSEYDALRYLFDYYSLSTAALINRPEISFASVLVDHYKMISQKLGYNVEPTEAQVNDYAYSCMELGRWNDAYKLFRMNTENHPQSSNAFDSLGDYYAARGDKPHAIEAYTQSLKLHETEDTRRKLNEVKK